MNALLTRLQGRWTVPVVSGLAILVSFALTHLAGAPGWGDVLMIAGGTGIAPVRCLVLDMLRYGDNPRVHLFYGARYPGDLYDLPTLVDLAATSPWLTVQPVAEEADDPWWAGPAHDLPRTLHRRQLGTLVDVVTRWGAWADRQVIIAGSPDMLRATVRGMVAAGTPRENISFDRP